MQPKSVRPIDPLDDGDVGVPEAVEAGRRGAKRTRGRGDREDETAAELFGGGDSDDEDWDALFDGIVREEDPGVDASQVPVPEGEEDGRRG